VMEGVEQTVRTAETYDPDTTHTGAYEARYATYREIYPALRGLGVRL
jgi:sugar (pentulose or hexulose) kinase